VGRKVYSPLVINALLEGFLKIVEEKLKDKNEVTITFLDFSSYLSNFPEIRVGIETTKTLWDVFKA
jgi:hypothetical protein